MKRESPEENAYSSEDPEIEELILEEELYDDEGLGDISSNG
ncbi:MULTISPECIES: hypothetical protein [Herbiconiux]|uniref:Uncharacterized protein n=1 Tax=Herbiconiux flava TaxID=881268 RepID=A0A852SM27_9MICO|nr:MULTISPECIES: hypothetical protein [Herbiconiux]NYD68897.1 hypothetical protein [Herbiconiux flava]GLK15641.1 hypothetical protein GCM10017602_01230 [Herbiconiux flava]